MQNKAIAELKNELRMSEANVTKIRAALSVLNGSGARQTAGRKPGTTVSPEGKANMRKAAKARWKKIKANGK